MSNTLENLSPQEALEELAKQSQQLNLIDFLDNKLKDGRVKSVNASHVNEHYQPVNKPIRVIL